MYCILDIATALIIVLSVYIGKKTGAVRMVLSALGVIIALVLASFISNAFDQYAYDKLVRPHIISSIENNIGNVTEDLSPEDVINEFVSEDTPDSFLSDIGLMPETDDVRELKKLIEEEPELLTNDEFRDTLKSELEEHKDEIMNLLEGVLPGDMINEAEKTFDKLISDSENIKDVLSDIEETPVPETIESNIVRPIAVEAVRIILFLAVYILVMIIFSVIMAVVRAVRKVPVIHGADSLIGGILGFLRAAVYMVIICVVIRLSIQLTGDGSTYINSEEISRTVVFKWIYNGVFSLISLILK